MLLRMHLSCFNLFWVGLDTHFPWRIHYLFFRLSFTVSVYCVPSCLQCIFLGQVHRGEFLISAMDRFGSFWMRYQRVIALPKTLRQLMNLQFDFYASVEFLNRVVQISPLLSARSSTSVLAKYANCLFLRRHFALPILVYVAQRKLSKMEQFPF